MQTESPSNVVGLLFPRCRLPRVQTSESTMWSSKMAAQSNAVDRALNTGNVDFLTTTSPCQIGQCGDDVGGEDMDTHTCVDHSILAIFEDSATSSEDTRQAEEESENLLSALTQMLEGEVDDVSSTLSPFDTLPDTKLLNYQEFGNNMTTTDVPFVAKLRPRVKIDAGKQDKRKVARLQPVFQQQNHILFQGPHKKADSKVDVFTSSSLVNLVKLMHPYCLKMCVEEEGRGQQDKLQNKRTVFSQGEIWKYEKPTEDSDEDINVVSDDDTAMKEKETEEDKAGATKQDSSTPLKSALHTGRSPRSILSKVKKRVSFGPVQVASFDQLVEDGDEKNLPSISSSDTPVSLVAPLLIAPTTACKSVDNDKRAEDPPPKSTVKAKSLSLQEYRQLQKKRQPLIEKQGNYTTKWPSVPQPPKELTPIICSHGHRQNLCEIKSSPQTDLPGFDAYSSQRAASWISCHYPSRPIDGKPSYAGRPHRLKSIRSEYKHTSHDSPKSKHTETTFNGAAIKKSLFKNPTLLSTDPPNPVLIRLPVKQTTTPSNSQPSPMSSVELQMQVSTAEPQPCHKVKEGCPIIPQTKLTFAKREPKSHTVVSKISQSVIPKPVMCDQSQRVVEELPEGALSCPQPQNPLRHTCSEQSAATDSGIEASDLTSLLEQFEEKQAEEGKPSIYSNISPSNLRGDMQRTTVKTSTKDQEAVRMLYDLEPHQKSEHVTPEPLGTEVIVDTQEVINVKRKASPSKRIQIIDPRPLPPRRSNASELVASPHTCSSVTADHDYCMPVHNKALPPLVKNNCQVKETPSTVKCNQVSIKKCNSPITADVRCQSALSKCADPAPPCTPLTPPPSPPIRGLEKGRYPLRSPSSDSSRSSSSSSSSSPSRSPKRRRFHHKHSGSRSCSSSPSRSVSRSPPRRRKQTSSHLRYSRSRSRSWSRSRSPSPSPTFCMSRRNIYSHRESWKLKREHKARLQKLKAIDERRVVYVGRIRRSMTHDELRERFSHFGEVECVSLHFREKGDHYGFVTFYNTGDAFAAIDNGGKLRRPDELPFDICFGGRRQFCNSDYADLDAKLDSEPSPAKSKFQELDFDSLLKQAQKGLR
ncbi:peroxisome proliferator-activated receptor gamma coactivator-related protein 1-like [Corythoichthys intestinalis]|uniref:peroxisome proliferator-activated receptor gamma coactivator-related protein 1-like n=1 Tax=Corythoichthys intestinalis TaxID=161448 RepID=UPI0025A68BE2|nr:peroxisome proliferator-activated receptor gamma coactivator-related protein 1-like [Corythoichthys intestinalis]